MLAEQAHEEGTAPAEVTGTESIWRSSKQHLENEMRRVNEEIKTYPHPIPACDLQFNYLLEERTRLAQELDRLAAFS